MKLTQTLILFLIFVSFSAQAQFRGLIVNEFSQGDSQDKEYIEFLVVGNRTCSDSTADLRNWIFDDNSGWYGAGAGFGIASGHYRFANIDNWSKVPFGSIILVYNGANKNGAITLADDPEDANNDNVYVVSISSIPSDYIDELASEPSAGNSNPDYIYPDPSNGGYDKAINWAVRIGLRNQGDAVVVVDPNNLDSAFFAITYQGLPAPGSRIPNISLDSVGVGKAAYLSGSGYNDATQWVISDVETPGSANGAVNAQWIASMKTGGSFDLELTANSTTLCSGGTLKLDLKITPFDDPQNYTYEWTGPDGFTDTVQDPEITSVDINDSGTYIVTVTYKDTCTATAQITINVSNGIPVNFKNPDTIHLCLGDSVLLSINKAPGTITWTPDNSTLNHVTDSTAWASPTVTTEYFVHQEGVCVSSDSVVVVVDSLPHLPISVVEAKDKYCKGEFISLVSGGVDGFPNIKFAWRPQDGSIPDSTLNYENTNLTATRPQYYIRTNTNGACVSEDSIYILVVEASVSATGIDTLVCPGTPVQIHYTGEDLEDFKWTPDYKITDIHSKDPIVSPDQTTTYTAEGKKEGCTFTVGTTINVKIPDLRIDPDKNPLCVGDSVTLTAGGTDITNLVWEPAICNGCTSVRINPDPNTTYKVKGNSKGCPDEAEYRPNYATASLGASLDQVCPGESAIIKILGDALTDIVWTPVICDGCDSIIVAPAQTTAYKVTFKTFDCPFELTKTIVVKEPFMNITGDSIVCPGTSTKLSLTGPSLSDISWNPADGDCNTCNENNVRPSSTTTYTVTAKSLGCDVQTAKTVTVLVVPEVLTLTILPNDTVFAKSQVTATVTSVPALPAGTQYTWLLDNKELSDKGSSITFAANDLGKFNLEVYILNGNGCKVLTGLNYWVMPAPAPEFPNAFTPGNHDGTNDVFRPVVLEQDTGKFVITEFKVFSRWGEKIYDDPAGKGWDGTFKNKDAPSDLYTYKIRWKVVGLAVEEEKRGEITLLR